ncbi:hypothetical protein EJ04DRAFT_564007 [Polyplosphaeria fusca]|uniref:AA1-like domain-containing protein n=1 Tax=Polyplosphaeria fusca TaxID=682080 RepID=A0A9P4UZX9_9PLEO|nr:hypothetical protein EJ04DRAFT_564007 [Polyplosphaeria fusca]
MFPLLPLLFLLFLLFLPLTTSHPSPSHTYTTPCNPPTLHIQNLTYTSSIIYSNPAHLSYASAHLTFNLSTPSLSTLTSLCSAFDSSSQQSDAGFFAWPRNYTCSGAPPQNATFSWARYPSSVLSVNETWVCGGHEYLAVGKANVGLSCQTVNWVNPNFTWPNPGGEVYSSSVVTCGRVDLTIVPKVRIIR